jgi:exopolyphosphatase/guanosine-5'-triphosphate,3'-diphosphate pyrophosphatase
MERIGIIDIGSNSIRLVIYEITETHAYHVIDESKESARLSERLDEAGCLRDEDLQYIVNILKRFKRLCDIHKVSLIRAAATAAIRNSHNGSRIAEQLTEQTGVTVQILSGAEEGRLGFLGVMNTMDIQDGFLIDIGGGSTEISLFRNRTLLDSVSFPFGAVNMMQTYGREKGIDELAARAMIAMIEEVATQHPWIYQHPGLPMVGLGGTMRSLCNMDQRKKKYSLTLTHNYQLSDAEVDSWLTELRRLPFEQRKRIEGLSKDRADIIIPGLIILGTLHRLSGATHYIVSGAGLRDGIFYETYRPEAPQFSDVLEHSVQNLLGLHPMVSLTHVQHVERLAIRLFTLMHGERQIDEQAGTYLRTAALLYRIGITIHYYQYHKHTFYLIAHSRIDGLTHREILLCAFIASFKSEKRLKQSAQLYKDVLRETDLELITKLGSLLQVAVALDRTETQVITDVNAQLVGKQLHLSVIACNDWHIERRELETLTKDFQDIWGVKMVPKSS